MEGKALVRIGVGAAIGLLVGSGFWSLQSVDAHSKVETAADAGGDDIASLRSANANLTESLADSERMIAALRAQLAGGAPPRPRPASSGGPGMRPDGGFRFSRYQEVSQSDWEEMAKVGAVAVTIPCLHDKWWTLPPSAVDRLGLSAQNGAFLQAAIEHSNKRVADQVRPYCTKVLGKPESAELVGTRVCLDAVVNAAKKSDLDGTHEALVRIAQANAGKGDAKPATGSGAAASAEQLINALLGETKAFEAELATKLGADEAKRITYAPETCLDRIQVQAKGEPFDLRFRPQRQPPRPRE